MPQKPHFLLTDIATVFWAKHPSVFLSQIDAHSGRFYTYSQLKDQAHRFSSGLSKRGFKKGDVIAILLPNVLEYPIIFHGVSILGGVTAALNPHCSHEELSHYLKISRAKFLVTIPPLAKKAFSAGVLKGICSVFVIGQSENCESISSLLSDDGSAFPRDMKINPKEDVVTLPFSSGTTGASKGVMLTHYNLVAQIRVLFRHGDPETVINVTPLFATYALSIIMGDTSMLEIRLSYCHALSLALSYKLFKTTRWVSGGGGVLRENWGTLAPVITF